MRALLLTLAGALALASCGKVDTVGGHYPGAKVYQVVGGYYHLHYPDPPWSVADPTVDFGALAPVLVAKGVYFGHDLSLYSYELQIDRVGCASPAAQAAAEQAVASGAGEVIAFAVRDFENSAGDQGSEFGTHDGAAGTLKALLSAKAQKTVTEHGYTVRARRSYFAATDAAGGCLRVTVLTVFDVEEHELTYLLKSFEPRAAEVTPSADAGGQG
jgi:hypothetical protein